MSDAHATTDADTRRAAYLIAARAGTDYRPVEGWLRGERELPRGVRGERIARAASELGLGPQPREHAQ